ncbi:MAG TPA: hypothetical protein ENK94_00945 [Campylobacterales bacterium]|nr:hypothetical protein [Campylobacterales bacterium]
MEIQLKNIGMIKEANVKIDGLTVIAGENDTGKSTVGKMLFSIIKSDNIAQTQKANIQNAKRILATRLNLVFDGNISYRGEALIKSKNNEIITEIKIRDKNFISKYDSKHQNSERFFDVTFVQSPIVFDMIDFFNSVSRMRERGKFELGLDFDVSYPYMMWDLYDKLSRENPYPHARRQQKIKNMITDIITGNLEFDSSKFYYHKIIENSAIKVEMENTATGIKSFGIIQILNDNKFFVKKNLLVLDEPEVHLHPKWQLKMAKIIVELVKNGVKVLVNSHSPYMIEALQRYGELENIQADFYLAKDGYIKKENDSNSETLAKTFEKLSEPFDVFEEMESERFQNG